MSRLNHVSTLVLIGVVLTCPALSSAVTRYVDDSATGGSNDGSDWQNAYVDLQSALAAASSGDEIWVAQGTYKPSAMVFPPIQRTATFTLISNVKLYGGFRLECVGGSNQGQYCTDDSQCPGSTCDQQRDPGIYLTILSGDLAGDDNPASFPNDPNRSENVYHVVTTSNTLSTTVLDGFTIIGGNADVINGQDSGGGILNVSGFPQVANCTFRHNTAFFGGAMANVGGAVGLSNAAYPLLSNCVFETNHAIGDAQHPSWGGAIYNNQACRSGCKPDASADVRRMIVRFST